MNWANSGEVHYATPNEYTQYIICYNKHSSTYVTEVYQCEADGASWRTREYHEFTTLTDAKHWCEVHNMVVA
jgi:hypothetical protein